MQGSPRFTDGSEVLFDLFVSKQSCKEREDTLYRGNNQVINLTTAYMWSGCEQVSGLVKELVCRGRCKIEKTIMLLLQWD